MGMRLIKLVLSESTYVEMIRSRVCAIALRRVAALREMQFVDTREWPERNIQL